MKSFLLLLVLLILVPAMGQENGLAQSKTDLVGTWKLVSASYTTDKGQVVKDAYGRNPTGFLTYTADGRMMAIIASGGRKPLSVANQVTAPASERAEAFSTITAYAGWYSVADGKVIHHVEVSAVQNEVNTDKVRTIAKLDGKRVTLRMPGSRAGEKFTGELVWERISGGSAP
jgi:hypothetical protein